MSTRAERGTRADYRHFTPITTRWNDNDSYRHVNNVVYYEFFDTAVNAFLITRGLLDLDASPTIGLVVETQCRYFSPISFPSQVHAGLRVANLGTSSIRYEIGLFRDDEANVSAQGHFIHVQVDRATGRPVPLPQRLRTALETLLVSL